MLNPRAQRSGQTPPWRYGARHVSESSHDGIRECQMNNGVWIIDQIAIVQSQISLKQGAKHNLQRSADAEWQAIVASS